MQIIIIPYLFDKNENKIQQVANIKVVKKEGGEKCFNEHLLMDERKYPKNK